MNKKEIEKLKIAEVKSWIDLQTAERIFNEKAETELGIKNAWDKNSDTAIEKFTILYSRVKGFLYQWSICESIRREFGIRDFDYYEFYKLNKRSVDSPFWM